MRRLWALLTAGAGLLLLASGARAQGNTTGTISGQVRSQDGAALPGVTVNATSPALQGARSTTTSTNGDYIFAFLPAGEYEVAFELTGFQPVKHAARGIRPCRYDSSRWVWALTRPGISTRRPRLVASGGASPSRLARSSTRSPRMTNGGSERAREIAASKRSRRCG